MPVLPLEATVRSGLRLAITLVAVLPRTGATQVTAPPGYDRPTMAYDTRRGVIVHFGGGDNIRLSSGETWEWNGTSWTKRDVPGPSGRFAHNMVYDTRRQRVVLYGGGAYGDDPTSETWEFDGSRWEQRGTGNASPGPRGGFGMAYDSARGRTVVYGGYGARDRTATGETWEWDGIRWYRLDIPGPTAKAFIRMAYDARRQRVVAFGGRGGGAETWEFDGQRWTKRASEGPPPRDHHAMAYDGDRQRVVVFSGGGQPTGIGTYTQVNDWLTDLWEWDGTRWTERAAAGPPMRVAIPGLAYDARRRVLVAFGGRLFGTWEWNGTRWRAPITGVVPAPRAGHVMASGGSSGGVFLTSGQVGEERRTVDTLWQWNGVGWRPLADNGPRYRTLPAAAFDTRRNVLVLYGGAGLINNNRYGDTWEWDGRAWNERPVDSPGTRDLHDMAYDEARGTMVMFGGQDGAREWTVSTWLYDGTAWRQGDSTVHPPGVAHHAMAYDARRQRVVLYGGGTKDRGTLHDVWEWDGARWQVVPSATPGPVVSHHRMAYDAARGVIVLFGGGDSTSTSTWTYDGSGWTEHKVAGPPARWSPAMAYDETRRVVLLFGGGRNRPPYDARW
jgi:hypothetical protein